VPAGSTKPDFSSIQNLYNKQNNTLESVKKFLPSFIKETDAILSDENLRKAK